MPPRLLQFEGHLDHAGIEHGERDAGVLVANVVAATEGGGGIEVAQDQAVGAVGHDAQEFAGATKHEVATRRIEFSENALEKIMVELEVIRRAEVLLELAFAIVTFASADENRVLEFKRIRGGAIDLAAEPLDF